MLELTDQNYYSNEANREYMSCSQYQDFLTCEARALAVLQGRWEPQETEAFLVGNYFHTAMESAEAHETFCKAHFEKIYKTKLDRKSGELVPTGAKFAAFEKADEMLEVCRRDPIISHLMRLPGENEKIMTGTLFGVPWKIRLDKYIPDQRVIIDWKTAQDLNKTEYNPITGERESFLEYLGYLMRAAVYSEIEKQYTGRDDDPNFIIVAVSKQTPPDKGAYSLNHRQRYDWELERIREKIYRIQGLKTGQFKPKRCGVCDYCRAIKVLTKIVPYYTLNPRFRDEREEETEDVIDTRTANMADTETSA